MAEYAAYHGVSRLTLPRRILVKGGSGSGKSTLARLLAERLEVPCIELDALHHGPNWTPAPAAELRRLVEAALDDRRGWVVDGNYGSKLGRTVVDRAELIRPEVLATRTQSCAGERAARRGPEGSSSRS